MYSSSGNISQDVKTVLHMEQVNLKKYRITSVDDALTVLEEAGDAMVRISLTAGSVVSQSPTGSREWRAIARICFPRQRALLPN